MSSTAPYSALNPSRRGPGGLRSIALLLLILGASASLAAPPDVVIDGTQTKPIGQHLFELEDESAALTIEQVSRVELAHRFTRSSKAVPNYGLSRSALWVRFTYLKSNLTPERRWYLTVRNPFLDHVDVYFQRPDGSFEVRRAGAMVPSAEREVANRHPSFLLPEPNPEPVTVYLRAQSSFTLALPVIIITEEQMRAEESTPLIRWWFYSGILASMVLYNAILYLILKDRAYLYYILYIIFFGLFTGLAIQAIGHIYFPDSGPLLARLIPAFLHLGCMFGALFTRSFLDTPRRVPRLDRMILVLASASGLSALLCAFIPPRISVMTSHALALVYGPMLLVTPLIVWRRGFLPARFFLAGWCTLSVAGVVSPLADQGWIPKNFVIAFLLQIGSAVEMILFSLALASRIGEAKKESEAARRQALEGELHRLRNIELRQANEEIVRKQEQLVQAEKMASLGQMTAGVAHEIKNPLNFINNFSLSLVELMDELSQEVQGLSADKQAALEMLASESSQTARKIAEHGRRADGIVRSMLEHAAVRPGERCLSDLNHLVESHLELAQQGQWLQRPGRPISLEKSLEPGLPPVELIPQELGRALLNLLNNALHAVGEQHKKGLAGYVPTVRVSTHRRDAHVEIRVQDNGTGIPAAVRERIFEPFFTTKPPGEGIGLGLSLTHGIILKRHAGTLEFESTEDKGTTFVITLPLPPSNAPAAGGATGECTA